MIHYEDNYGAGNAERFYVQQIWIHGYNNLITMNIRHCPLSEVNMIRSFRMLILLPNSRDRSYIDSMIWQAEESFETSCTSNTIQEMDNMTMI
jgi:hypothetical protein